MRDPGPLQDPSPLQDPELLQHPELLQLPKLSTAPAPRIKRIWKPALRRKPRLDKRSLAMGRSMAGLRTSFQATQI